jgi:hypothetical protein
MITKIDDSELLEMEVSSGDCFTCINHITKRKCKAFKKIPLEIWEGKHDHKTPYPGDNGILFEPLK